MIHSGRYFSDKTDEHTKSLKQTNESVNRTTKPSEHTQADKNQTKEKQWKQRADLPWADKNQTKEKQWKQKSWPILSW